MDSYMANTSNFESRGILTDNTVFGWQIVQMVKFKTINNKKMNHTSTFEIRNKIYSERHYFDIKKKYLLG